MDPLELVKLRAVMELTSGQPELAIGLIDGPVAIDHDDFSRDSVRTIPDTVEHACSITNSVACQHGTLVAGILSAKRASNAPAICPGCTLLVRPIFAEASSDNDSMPWAAPEELAGAIRETIRAGAGVLNLSSAIARITERGERELYEALNYAATRGVVLVAAAGNQALVGSTCITRHPWVIPVVACTPRGEPLNSSNLGNSIGQRGLRAPGENITSLSAHGGLSTFDGTSAAAPFVTGAIALLLSEFPKASPAEVKLAVIQASSRRRNIIPPILDAWGAYQALATNHGG